MSTTTKSRTVSRNINKAAKTAHHIHSVAHDAGSSISRNGTKAVSKLQSLRDRFKDGKEAAVTSVKRAATTVRVKAAAVDKTIRAKPYQSLGIAAGAGLVAGYFISRRRAKA
jgi:ElaB/YqjD/DUF883 family membrane-anchored ribosome-binding protein